MPQLLSPTFARHLASRIAFAGLLLIGLASLPLHAEDAPAAAGATAAKPAIDMTLLHFEPITNPVIGTRAKYRAETIKGTADPVTKYVDNEIIRTGVKGTRIRESTYPVNWEGIIPAADGPKPASTGTLLRWNEDAVFSDMVKGVPYTTLTSVDDTLEVAGKTWNTRHIKAVGSIAQGGKTYTFEYEYWFSPEVPMGGLLKRISGQTSPVADAQSMTLTYLGHEIPSPPSEPVADLVMAKKLYDAALVTQYSVKAEQKNVLHHEVVQSLVDAGEEVLVDTYINRLDASDSLTREYMLKKLNGGDFATYLDSLQMKRKYFLITDFQKTLESHDPPIPVTDAMVDGIHTRMQTIWKSTSKVAASQVSAPNGIYPGHQVYHWVKLLLDHGRREDAEKVAKDFIIGTSPAIERLLAGDGLAKGDNEAVSAYLEMIRAQNVDKTNELTTKLFPQIQLAGDLPLDNPLRAGLIEEIRTATAAIEDDRQRNRYEQHLAVVLSKGTAAEQAEARKIVSTMPTPLMKIVMQPLAQNLGLEIVAEAFDRTYQPSEVYTYWDANLEFLITLRVMGADEMYMAMVDELVQRHMVYTAAGDKTQYANNIVRPLFEELLDHGHQEKAIQAMSKILYLKSNNSGINEVVNWVAEHGTQADIEQLKKVSETVFNDNVERILNGVAMRGDAELGLWLCALAKPNDNNFLSGYKIRLAVATAEAGDTAAALAQIETVLTGLGTGRLDYADAVAWVILKSGDPKRAMTYFEENFLKGGGLEKLDGTETYLHGPRGRFTADMMTAAYREGYETTSLENYCLDKQNKGKALGRNFIAIGLARGYLVK